MVREGRKAKLNCNRKGKGLGEGREASRQAVYSGLPPLPRYLLPPIPAIHTFYTPPRSPPGNIHQSHPITQLTSHRHHPSTLNPTHPPPKRQPNPHLPIRPLPGACSPHPSRRERACLLTCLPTSPIANPKRALSVAQHHNNLRRRLGTRPGPLPTNNRSWWFEPHSSRQPRPHHKHITSTARPSAPLFTITTTTTTTTTTTAIYQINPNTCIRTRV